MNPEKKKEIERELLEDKESLLPGSGVVWFQFDKPDYRILRTFDSPKDNSYTIEISSAELTAMCPLTGFPDFYQINVSYIPDKKCIESKSCKFYFHSFRNTGMFIEALTNKIADDWMKACHPKYLKITNTMNSRGGIAITVVVGRKKNE